MKISVKKAFRTLIFLLAVIGIGGAIVWMAGDEDADNAKPQKKKRGVPQLVEVEVARKGEIARTLEVTGEVIATDTVTIAATKEGPISHCPWREGDRVKKGEKLVEIDRRVHQAELQQAEAALKIARAKLADLRAGARPEEVEQAKANVQKWKATLEEAQTAYERQQQLITRDFTSRQAVDQARERMKVARAELANAQEKLRMLKAGPTKTDIAVQAAAVDEAAAKLDLAQAHLAECLIKAPFDGIITEVHVRPGDLAIPRSPLLEMYDAESLVIRFAVPERHAATVHPGMHLEATLDAFKKRPFEAEVTRVYPQLDAATRTRTGEAKLVEPDGILPGMFGRIKLELKRASDAVVIPAEAILAAPNNKSYVFIVKTDKVHRQMVEIGIEQDNMVEILNGIEPGQDVVVVGQAMLRDDQPVRILGQEAKSGPGKARKNSTAEAANANVKGR